MIDWIGEDFDLDMMSLLYAHMFDQQCVKLSLYWDVYLLAFSSYFNIFARVYIQVYVQIYCILELILINDMSICK